MSAAYSYSTRYSMSQGLGRGRRNTNSSAHNARRQLHYSGSERCRTPTLYFPTSFKKRSTLGRRKSLGFNLQPSTVSLQLNNQKISQATCSTSDSVSNVGTSSIHLTRNSKLSKNLTNKSLFTLKSSIDVSKISTSQTNDKSYLALPIAALPNISVTTNLNTDEQQPTLPIPANNLLSLPESNISTSSNSLNSVDEFLVEETKIVEENKNNLNDVLRCASQSNVSANQGICENPISQIDQQSNLKIDFKTPTKLEQTLLQSLLQKMDEYEKLMTDAKKKYDEIKIIKDQLVGTDNKANYLPFQETDSSHLTTPIFLKKSVKKFHNSTVKFSNDIIPVFTIPQTPLSVTKSTIQKKKSIGYTPRSLKKVLSKQTEDLCD